MKFTRHRQTGASLIEVLVAVLILSFGMLALGGMLAYAVQMPKLAAYRAIAMSHGTAHVERMRANMKGYRGGAYLETLTYKVAPSAFTPCTFPCDSGDLAKIDKNDSNVALSRDLPDGGMRVICNGDCKNMEGELWVFWTEPKTFATLSAAGTPETSDECPEAAVVAAGPRCLHIKFKL